MERYAAALLLFLTACTPTIFGIPEEQWLSLTDEQKQAVIQNYYQRDYYFPGRLRDDYWYGHDYYYPPWYHCPYWPYCDRRHSFPQPPPAYPDCDGEFCRRFKPRI